MTAVDHVYQAGKGIPEWADDVLTRRAYGVLGTINPDGTVHTVPLMYAFDGERFLFESRSTTRKVRNLAARPHARVLVEGPPGDERWIAAQGAAQIVEGEEAQRLNAIVAGRYLTDAGRAGWARTIGPLEDVTIVLTPETWTWWDTSGMFGVIAEGGYTEQDVAGWFQPPDP